MDYNYVLVLGAGVSGISATKALLRLQGIKVIIYDENVELNKNNIYQEIPDDSDYTIMLGELEDSYLDKIELVVISPGFPKFKTIVKKIKERKIPIIGEIEFGYMLCKGKICAVTGSNGKTTTVTLVGEILKKYFNDVHICGNIGNPFTREAEWTTNKSVTVLELSSFQLEDIINFKPNVASILNISPDHLDRYDKYEDYINAKLNIIMNQTEEDYCILNYDSNILRELVITKKLFKSKIIFFSSKKVLSEGFYYSNGSIYFKENMKTTKLIDTKDVHLIGIHNYENIMASIAMCYCMGVPLSVIIDGVKKFKPIEHRIEFVCEKCGVKFYNDSKGTNPDASIKAIDAMNGKIILIAGGHDKGVDYGDFVSKVKEKVKNLILIGEAQKNIANKCKAMNYTKVSFANSIEEAVDIAVTYANIGDNILLSPACSSFDMFKNYEERGEKFKAKVNSLR